MLILAHLLICFWNLVVALKRFLIEIIFSLFFCLEASSLLSPQLPLSCPFDLAFSNNSASRADFPPYLPLCPPSSSLQAVIQQIYKLHQLLFTSSRTWQLVNKVWVNKNDDILLSFYYYVIVPGFRIYYMLLQLNSIHGSFMLLPISQ